VTINNAGWRVHSSFKLFTFQVGTKPKTAQYDKQFTFIQNDAVVHTTIQQKLCHAVGVTKRYACWLSFAGFKLHPSQPATWV